MSSTTAAFEKAALEKGLPSNVEAERLILGSILLNDSRFIEIAGAIDPEDFSLEKHRRIYARMVQLHERGEKIDRITVANELQKFNELASVDGLSYLVSLDDGLPNIANLESYVKIVREKSTLRRIVLAAQHLMNRALVAEEHPDDILGDAEKTLLSLGEARGEKGLMSPLEVIQNYQGGLNAFLDPSKRIKGISTGFTKLDEMTGGLHSGELIILAARPSMGKTAFALNIAWHVATRLFRPVAVFSLEMSQESLLTRMLCAAARVDSHRFRTGYLNEKERQLLRAAANQMVEAPLFIDDTAGANLMDMHAKLRRLHQSGQKLGLVVVDYLQLMSSKGRVENRNQEVSQISRGLKLLSKELDCPFLVLSQLSRATETRQGDHRPQLSDLRESGCLTGDTLIPIPCSGKRVPIRELAGTSGFHVWALNEQTMKLERAPVSRAFATGTKPVFELRTRRGRTIRATANHPFRAYNGWKRLDELAPGERIALPRLVLGGGSGKMSFAELTRLGSLVAGGRTRIPEDVFQQSAEAIAIFIRHLWSAGGRVSFRKANHGGAPLAYYATSSAQLAADLQSLLLRLQLNATVKLPTQGAKGPGRYRVILSGAAQMRKFAERVAAADSGTTEAMDRLNEWLAGNPANRDAVPPRVSHIYWDSVESIGACGEEEVYDLTVPGHHNFVAADFIVHNSIEQDADLVGFIFREEVYKRDREDLHGVAELILSKQRNGPIGTVPLVFLHAQTRFENRAEDLGDLPPE